MRVVSCLVAFVFLGLLLSLPAAGAQNKDKDKKDADKDKAKPAEKWAKAGGLRGKVVNVDEAKKSLRIEVPVAKDKNVPYELQSIDEVKVRFDENALPPKFDDKGRIKRYTPKEKKELKGDDKKTPGYPAEFSDLKQGQIVQVTLVQKKGAPRKAKGADPTGEYAPHMSLIVILANPQQ
ncbi:MAG TPA: hypothetical protein VH575_07940 [Gemmataceae bacterium]|jgi:preprotein translocase subunit YajC